MPRLFAVTRTRGPAWDATCGMEQQQAWAEHAAFITALYEQGHVLLVGPLEETAQALLVMQADDAAQIAALLADDPWSVSGHLSTAQVAPWTLRLGAIASAQRR